MAGLARPAVEVAVFDRFVARADGVHAEQAEGFVHVIRAFAAGRAPAVAEIKVAARERKNLLAGRAQREVVMLAGVIAERAELVEMRFKIGREREVEALGFVPTDFAQHVVLMREDGELRRARGVGGGFVRGVEAE